MRQRGSGGVITPGGPVGGQGFSQSGSSGSQQVGSQQHGSEPQSPHEPQPPILMQTRGPPLVSGSVGGG